MGGDAVPQAVSLCNYNMTLRWFNSGQNIPTLITFIYGLISM